MSTIADFISEERITWLPACGKQEALQQMLGLLSSSGAVKDVAALQQAILSREVMMSTGLGYGIALPHARIAAVDHFVVAIGIASDGIDWGGGLDDDPVRLVVMIAGPDQEQAGYLRLLSTLMKFVKSEKGKILSAAAAGEVLRRAERYELRAEA